jgi:mRNA interferase MazF
LAHLDPVLGSEQAGTRPVVVVSRNALNRTRRHAVAIPITTFRGRRLLPSHLLVRPPDGGLRVESVVLVDQIRTLSDARFEQLWGSFSARTMDEISEHLLDVLFLRPR